MEGLATLSPLSSPSEVTQTWLEQRLKRKMGSLVKINTWSMKEPETKDGYLSEIRFIKINFFVCVEKKEEKEERLFAKFLPEDEKILNILKKERLGEREIKFYRQALTKEFQVFCKNSGMIHPVPEVYLAELKDNKLSLVLHDLKSDDFKLSVPIKGNSLQQIKSTLAAIAVIHASGIATIRNHGRNLFDIPWSCSGWSDFLVEGINIQLKILEGTPAKNTVESLLGLSEKLLTVEEKHPFVETLIHGDLWTANVMFSQQGQDACIIDWQFARTGNPVCDIVCLLLTSGAPHIYTEHLTEVLECYWESFEQSLKKNGISVDITFQDLVRNVDSMWMYGYMFFTLSISSLFPNHIDEDRVKAIIHFLEKNEVFKKFLS